MRQRALNISAEAGAFLRHSLRDWGGRTMLTLGAYVLLFFAWQIFDWSGPAHRVLIAKLAVMPVTIMAGVLALRAGLRPVLPDPVRRGWRLIGCSLLLYWVGDLVRFIDEVIRQVSFFPSIADLFYLLQYPLLLWGTLSLSVKRNGRFDLATFWLDAVTVLISGWAVTWFLVVGPTAAASVSPLTRFLSVAYPLSDLFVFFGALVILYRPHEGTNFGPRSLLAVGLFLFYAGDLANGRLLISGQYQAGNWPDTLSLAGHYIMLAGAQWRYFRRPGPVGRSPVAARARGLLILTIPYLAVLLTFGLLLFSVRLSGPTGSLLLGAVAVTLTVMARQILVLRENTQLLRNRVHLLGRLRHLAFHDPLTGLANRTRLRERVEEALTGQTEPVALLFIDLDGFKTVNDSLGHLAGDELLQAVSTRMLECAGPADTVARLGGDEFALLLPHTDQPEATQVAEDVAAALAQPFSLAEREVYVYGSTGIAISHPSAPVTPDELLRNADVAMYTAKGMGHGRHALFHASMHEAAVARLELEADLRAALEAQQFFLHYQPVVHLASGGIVGVEALVRWQHPVRGVVGPTEFIPLCEETGLIIPLGRFVLQAACRQVARWQRAYPGDTPIALSVNISPRQLLLGPLLVADVENALNESGLAPGSLTLEITESVLMHGNATTVGTLTSLKELGIRLAIDDFGTGYSSLSYLRGFPVDEVKIDRSFIGAVGDGFREAALLRGIVDLSQALGMVAVAEGIERPDQAAHLEGLGCPLGQGYYFSRPGTAEQIGWRLAVSREPDHANSTKHGAEGPPL